MSHKVVLPSVNFKALPAFPQQRYEKLKRGLSRNRSFSSPLIEMEPVVRNVRFSDTLAEIDIIPNDRETRTSRAGSWGIAPFHDTIWDGERRSFREEEISETEVYQENFRHSLLVYLSRLFSQSKSSLGFKDVPEAEVEKEFEEDKCFKEVDEMFLTMYNSFCTLIGS